ncbi:NADPH oxidase 5-like isoform X2 [Mya arenaria]|uniref:NADPH oxidase 5-like isoform X2 n=1 Tax=Mya arenaria TaxID=6604 RepID=UPI0022E0CDF9|nr:NADPH oxidase 5-like isoform X2 [Mya arenaria]
MSEDHVTGSLNPAYVPDTDEETVRQDGDNKRHTYVVPDSGNKDETVVDIPKEGNGQTGTVGDILRKSPAQARDIAISITDHSTEQHKMDPNNKENDNTTSSNDNKQSSNGDAQKKPLQLRQSVAASLRKREQAPDLDEKGTDTLKVELSDSDLVPQRTSSIPRGYFDTKKPITDEDSKWLHWIEVKFMEIAGDDGEIDRDEFKKALGVKKSFFAERFFELFDQDASGTIEMNELMDGLRMLTKGTPAQKLQFLFDVYDADGSGSIDRDELMEVLKACMEESSLSLTEDNLEDLTDALFDAADEDESGTITFEEMRDELEKHPGVIENLTISAAQWLKPPSKQSSDKTWRRYFTADYLKNNLRKVVFFLVYWIVNVVLYILGAYNHRDHNWAYMFARGAGLCLNFNCMWILVLMLRKCITFARMTQLCHVLPFDQHILFHKMTGIAIVIFTAMHTCSHIGNALIVENETNITSWEILFTPELELGLAKGAAFITGWILIAVLTVMVVCSLPFVRASGHFQIFYWTHTLYVPFWILLILHCENFWKWFIAPGVLFILEKISRSKLIKFARYGDIFIEEVNLLPSGVTHLVISRPSNFRYKPGDYIFIQIPCIAKYEWHPFTISSAPEMEGSIWLHVRSAGHWTNKLYKYFEDYEEKEAIDVESRTRSRRTTMKKFENIERGYSRRNTKAKLTMKKSKPREKNKVVKVKCYIDGPYGTGTREVFDTDHAVLIGAGIGVTPMASILQSVWYRFSATKQQCPSCEHTWYPEDESMDMNLKKVDFIWINRDQRSFEWFLTLLNQIEMQQSEHHGRLENCIQMHMYMTAAQKKTDMKGIGLQVALDLMYEKSQRDLITGLRTKTEPGRPDWTKIFKGIKAEKHGKVKVFFCGAPALGKTVKEKCAQFSFAFSKENF